MTEEQIQDLEGLKLACSSLTNSVAEITETIAMINTAFDHIASTLGDHNDCIEKLIILINEGNK